MAAVAKPTGWDSATCSECGGPKQHRSDIDHGMFWAIITRAFKNWPEQHEFCPMDKYELYGWLLIEAEHCVSGLVEDKDTNAIRKSARTFLDLAGESEHPIYYMRLVVARNGVKVTIPKSLSYKTAGKRKFEDVRSKIYEIIEVTLNVKIEDLKREARREAA
jgi:hypothetical protein